MFKSLSAQSPGLGELANPHLDSAQRPPKLLGAGGEVIATREKAVKLRVFDCGPWPRTAIFIGDARVVLAAQVVQAVGDRCFGSPEALCDVVNRLSRGVRVQESSRFAVAPALGSRSATGHSRNLPPPDTVALVDLHVGGRGRPAATVFHLFGQDEDDLTRSLAWGMARSESLTRLMLDELDLPFEPGEFRRLEIQRALSGRGRTDIELLTASSRVIFEAKVGWALPGEEQVRMYETRLRESIERSVSGLEEDPIEHAALVTLSECTPAWAESILPEPPADVARAHLAWGRVITLAETAAKSVSTHEKKMLRDLADYLRSTTLMRDDPSSQMTWVVPVSDSTPEGSNLNFQETVQSGWYYNLAAKVPKGPFNFVGFRWSSALREIRYVKSRRLFIDPHTVLPEIFPEPTWWGGEQHELLELGPAIVPNEPLPYGKLYAPGYHRALLDCLLTASTVAEARDWSQARFDAAGLPF